ncbi:MAG: hypothetical protein QM773_14130 [Hyphomonadaceae bacterium]
MMLDKGQITDWEGEPESGAPPKASPAAEPARGGISGAIFDSREAVPTGEFVKVTPEQAKARKRRGQWIALALFAFVIVLFTLTMTKMGAQVLVRDL